MFIDWTYIVYVLPAVIFSLWASAKVNGTYNKYAKYYSRCGMTGYDMARSILSANGLSNVQIYTTEGKLSDHYDPKRKVLRLSKEVYYGTSMVAIGVAAHECGHALQDAKRYFPMKIRGAIVPVTNFASRLSMPLIFLGLIFSSFSQFFVYVAYVGVACFSLCALFQLITLPVEFNASKRGLTIIKNCGSFSSEEVAVSKKMLSAAALTYVAALAVTFAQILRLLVIIGRRDRRR